MRKHRAAIFFFSFIILLAGAALAADGSVSRTGAAGAKFTGKKIDDEMSLRPQDAHRLMGQRNDLQLVDVRSPAEFRQGALEGTENIPFIRILEGRHTLQKDKPVLLVCTIGGRSYAAGQILLERGYREVYNLDGGLVDWQRERLPLRFQGIITQ